MLGIYNIDELKQWLGGKTFSKVEICFDLNRWIPSTVKEEEE